MLVVGGGYTGLWTAWQLAELEPEARVVVLEAGRCGHGPSGRNGGFANEIWFGLPLLRDRYGDDRFAGDRGGGPARRSTRSAASAPSRRWTPGTGRRGYLLLSAAPAQDGVWSEAVALCHELGQPDAARELSAEEVAKRLPLAALPRRRLLPRRRHRAAGPAGARPARPGREPAQRQGLRTVADCAVCGPGSWGCVAETPAATVRARSCVLALGAASNAVGSPFRNRLTVTSSHMAITEPVPDVLEEAGWTGGECITDSRAMLHYFRTTPDGRIAFGWGGGRVACGARLGGLTEHDPTVVDQVVADLRSFFPGLEGRAIAHAWGGPIDVSPTHLPVAMQVGSDRVFGAFGYTGNGVGPSHLMGGILASLALDRRDELTRLALVEPDPARVPGGLPGWAGGNAIRAGLLAKEAAEEEERIARAIHRGLASIPERIGFHIGR